MKVIEVNGARSRSLADVAGKTMRGRRLRGLPEAFHPVAPVAYKVTRRPDMIPTEENDAFVIVDMLNDFIDGALANPIAKAAVKPTVRFIESFRGRKILVLKDTHPKKLCGDVRRPAPAVAHCIKGTPGADVNPEIQKALDAFRARGALSLKFRRITLC